MDQSRRWKVSLAGTAIVLLAMLLVADRVAEPAPAAAAARAPRPAWLAAPPAGVRIEYGAADLADLVGVVAVDRCGDQLVVVLSSAAAQPLRVAAQMEFARGECPFSDDRTTRRLLRIAPGQRVPVIGRSRGRCRDGGGAPDVVVRLWPVP